MESYRGNWLDRIGGKRKLKEILRTLSNKVVKDESLVQFFQGYDMKDLIEVQKRILIFALNEFPQHFDVIDLVIHKHQRFFERGLNETHFDTMTYYMIMAFRDCNVEQALIDELFHSVNLFRKAFEDGPKRFPPLLASTGGVA